MFFLPLYGNIIINGLAAAPAIFGSSGLDLKDPVPGYGAPHMTEGNDYYVWAPLEAYRPDHNEFDMKGGDDFLNIQFNDYFDMPVEPVRIFGGAGTDTLALAVDNGRGLILEQAIDAKYGPAFKATIVAKPDGTTETLTFQIRQFEKFNILSSDQADRITTGQGNDIVSSGGGVDVVSTGAGEDNVVAGAGDDVVDAGDGNDIVYGNSGNDTIFGDHRVRTNTEGFGGQDQIYGGSGNDTIYDFHGYNNSVYGGYGSDRIIVTGQFGSDYHGGYAKSEEMNFSSKNGVGSQVIKLDRGTDVFSVDLGYIGNQIDGTLYFSAFAGRAYFEENTSLTSFTFDGFEEYRVQGHHGVDNIVTAGGSDFVAGNLGNDIILSGAGDDQLYGGNGVDRLVGEAGSDFLFGGAGSDILTGGAQADRFYFELPTSQGGKDTITDFQVGLDKIVLESAYFGGLIEGQMSAGAFLVGSKALAADDRIIYNKATGDLMVDINGNAAGGETVFAKLQAGLNLTATDFLII